MGFFIPFLLINEKLLQRLSSVQSDSWLFEDSLCNCAEFVAQPATMKPTEISGSVLPVLA